MRKFSLSLTLAILLVAVAALLDFASAAPIALPGQSGAAINSSSVIQQADYIWRGRRYCWYNRGWNGPGWYWCGYAWRGGYGWGGPRGWNAWAWGGWAPGIVVGPNIVVRPAPYYWNGRYWHHRYWYGGRWYYR